MTEQLTPEKNSEQNKPFDGGSFTIEYFAPAGGLEFVPQKSLRRREELTETFPTHMIRQANASEVEYQEGENKKAQAKGEKRTVNPLISPDFRVKVGILNLREDGGKVLFDTKPISFVMFNDDSIGLSVPDNEKARSEFGTPLAVAMILFTTEINGTSKMIIQHRGLNNRSYKDDVGASAAGYLDQPAKDLIDGHLKPIDSDFIFKTAQKEMEEETGIDPEYLSSAQIAGIAKDKIRIHYEALLLGKVSISAQEAKTLADKKQSINRGAFNFAEDCFVIDGTPEAIRILLTDMKNPIPPTHSAAFLAVGRLLVLERDGQEAAERWTSEMEEEVRKNSTEIDEIVRKATMGSEKGYNPKKTPQEQGLPDVYSELRRVGLV